MEAQRALTEGAQACTARRLGDFAAAAAGQLTRRRSPPLTAASIMATSIFFIGIIASNARLAAAVSGLVVASSRTRGVICQEKPHLSLHQPPGKSAGALWPAPTRLSGKTEA